MKKKDLDQLISPILARKKRGIIFIVSGPSGVGKTTACAAMLKLFSDLVYSISYTTRTKRDKEVDGKDYFFVSQEEFNTMIREGKFLEWARVHGKLYGTSGEKIRKETDAGRSVILDIDVQGAEQIRKKEKDSVSIFLLPPSGEALYRRLTGRDSDSSKEIENRIEVACDEIKHYSQYDYLLVNDDLNKSIGRLEGIIRAEHHRNIRRL